MGVCRRFHAQWLLVECMCVCVGCFILCLVTECRQMPEVRLLSPREADRGHLCHVDTLHQGENAAMLMTTRY